MILAFWHKKNPWKSVWSRGGQPELVCGRIWKNWAKFKILKNHWIPTQKFLLGPRVGHPWSGGWKSNFPTKKIIKKQNSWKNIFDNFLKKRRKICAEIISLISKIINLTSSTLRREPKNRFYFIFFFFRYSLVQSIFSEFSFGKWSDCPHFVRPSVTASSLQGVDELGWFMAWSKAYEPRIWIMAKKFWGSILDVARSIWRVWPFIFHEYFRIFYKCVCVWERENMCVCTFLRVCIFVFHNIMKLYDCAITSLK